MAKLDLKNKRLFISGATGSYGTYLINYLKDTGVTFVGFSRDESKQHDLWAQHRDWPVEWIVGDIRDREKLFESMKNIDYVAHAAALKHVPTGEIFPEEIVKTNIEGTRNIIEAAEYNGVHRVVVLSSDKAAYPLNAYGASKLLGEKIVMAHKGNTVNVCLRYGNVLGSRGSVIPLWLEQVKNSQPITVTAYGMTRFLITLEQAVLLSLKCLSDGRSGDLFVMKPQACSIRTLADAFDLNFGCKLKRKVIGVRPGEKFHECLVTSDEIRRGIKEHEDGIVYIRVPVNMNKNFFDEGKKCEKPKDFTSLDAEQLNAEQVLAKLKEAKLL